MELYQIILIIVAALAGVLILQLTLTAIIVDTALFGSRMNKKPYVRYFTAEDFNITSEPVELSRGKYKLRGFVYTDGAKAAESTVVFCHGMGAGHIAYTTEIACLCRAGYRVLAIDDLGCNFSDGKKIRGFSEGVLAARIAVNYAKSNFGDGKIYLVGHSLGAYSALCATKWEKVDGVVSISAPESPLKIIKGHANKFLFTFVSPFLSLIFFLKYGAAGNMSASKAIDKSGVPALLIHGDKDDIVTLKYSAYRFAEGKNVEKYLAEGKRHNPYNTVAAEGKLKELTAALDTEWADKCLEENFYKSFDFVAATEEDGAVMEKIIEFLK